MVVFSRTKFTYLVYFAAQEGAIKYKLITNQYKKGWTIFLLWLPSLFFHAYAVSDTVNIEYVRLIKFIQIKKSSYDHLILCFISLFLLFALISFGSNESNHLFICCNISLYVTFNGLECYASEQQEGNDDKIYKNCSYVSTICKYMRFCHFLDNTSWQWCYKLKLTYLL